MARLVLNGKAPDLSTIPDVLLPAQLSRTHRPWPAENLMLAVLDDAIGEYRRLGQGSGRRACRLFGELTAWFAADDHNWTFSFANICLTVGLDANRIRAALAGWPRPAPRRRPPTLRVAPPAPPKVARVEADLLLARAG